MQWEVRRTSQTEFNTIVPQGCTVQQYSAAGQPYDTQGHSNQVGHRDLATREDLMPP